MSAPQFTRATKRQSRARIGLIGPAGSGKTYTALAIGSRLGERVAVVDTERGSASKYSDDFEFDVLELDDFHPQRYIDAIDAAASAGFDVLVIDSLSHAWMGAGGALELVDRAQKKSQSGNSFAAWREVTPLHNKLVDAILRAPLHVIVTIRAKTDYVQEKDERTGRTQVRKVGLAPVQRDGLEYEFDIVADIDAEHNMVVSKTRCRGLDGQVFPRAGEDVARLVREWLTDGAPMPEPSAEERKARLVSMVRAKAQEMNAKGYTPKWTAVTFKTYISAPDKFPGHETVESLSAAQLEELLRDFSLKLDALLAEGSAERSLAGARAPQAIDRAAAAEGGVQ